MLVLALDTTTRGGSCALARAASVLREDASDPSRSHAERLPGDLMTLLDRAGVPLRAVDVFAVATGPGSFTGLRVGIATMQGLAFAAGKPLVGVSTLDALAHIGARSGERIATWVDAWRGEVYAALYEEGREASPPTVAPPAELLEHLRARPTIFIGDGAQAHEQVIRETMGGAARVAEPAAPLLAGMIAMLAIEAARAGELPPPHAIRPLYVRRPDAELARMTRDARANP